ncbi:chitobiosyldiphosphodolichol beta-mannosyltransferase-like [Ornithodoros turicata]|uniref:chitobiosyldiphosphodolichol beta-mannosyltransferase-like n=1 Tax=Ornithodoros turicata TaxID=34597 RepID=UPI0031393E38
MAQEGAESVDNAEDSVKGNVTILVLGDFGHSPRMTNHALSLAAEGYSVHVIAYRGSQPKSEVLMNDRISLRLMNEPPAFHKYLPRLLAYVVKVLWQCVLLMCSLLFTLPSSSHLLVQNPPSVPTLPVAWFCCLICRSKLVVDWHNYGWSILALTLGSRNHPLVRLCAWNEKVFGRKAHSAFCVSRAMKEDLEKEWGVVSKVLYDRPPETFKPLKVEEKHDILKKLSSEYPELRDPSESPDATRLTRLDDNGSLELRHDRPAVLVSATSWTEDEDFSLLLNALEGYDQLKQQGDNELPDILCIVTGKGPLKSHYLEEVKSRSLKHVQVMTPWLSAEDYPLLLGTADLGICLHTSSSKLDLPMKVVDMFGCGLPVCAVSYPCLEELVQAGKTGLVFTTAEELLGRLTELLASFPKNTELLDSLRASVLHWQTERWEPNWKSTALEAFRI